MTFLLITNHISNVELQLFQAFFYLSTTSEQVEIFLLFPVSLAFTGMGNLPTSLIIDRKKEN